MADTFTENIRAVADLVESNTNKVTGPTSEEEGVVGEKLDVLDLPMEDKDLLKLKNQWEGEYAPYEGEINKTFKRNKKSYLGRSADGATLDSDQPGPANLQFEAEETFIPAALAENPDPVVYCDNTPEGNELAEDSQTMLEYHADQLNLKQKLAIMVRHWSIYQLAVLKHGWDAETNDVTVDNRPIKKFIFDPNGYVDAFGHFSSWLGERIEVTAERLIELFPKKKAYIEESVEGKLGTKVVYTEWWTDKFTFTSYKEEILDKSKNPYFNYNEKETDELGIPLAPKRNHFAIPRKPYTFLSVFSLQERPHDETGLIEQNIPNQNKITKRTEQIDANVSKSNNSELFSENNFNQETAKQAAEAIKDPTKGQVLIPQGGPIAEAIVRLPAPSFPEAGFKDLENSENHLRSSWGVQGIASQPQKPDETARGMILNQGRDTSRIGGGISAVLEQSVARDVFNWLIQLYMVFYDEKHFASVMGVGKAVKYAELSASDFNRQLIVTVAPNSMKPKDEITKMNQATSLFQMGAIGPKTLLETLDFPNADEAAADGVLYKADPQAYMQMNFPDLMAQLQQFQAQQVAQTQALQPQPQPSPTPAPIQSTEQASANLANVSLPK